MAQRRRSESPDEPSRSRPATTPMGREQQLISSAMDLAEKQIREGTASSQVISHFLKLGSSRELIEQERLRHEVELMEVKKQNMESMQNMEKAYADAMNAFRGYAGLEPIQSEEDFDEYDDR